MERSLVSLVPEPLCRFVTAMAYGGLVRITRLGLPARRTLVVLGAGATRGASFVASDAQLHVPPLDADFFRLLSRSPAGRSQQARALLQYVAKNHSAVLDVSMEAIFVELQGSAEF
jgi:hypothetical protein